MVQEPELAQQLVLALAVQALAGLALGRRALGRQVPGPDTPACSLALLALPEQVPCFGRVPNAKSCDRRSKHGLSGPCLHGSMNALHSNCARSWSSFLRHSVLDQVS